MNCARLFGPCSNSSRTWTSARLPARLPAGWDSHRFFAIGPRHLEAVLTRTAQVLVEGTYNGILQPWRHYLPVRRDFANLPELLEMVRDHALLQNMVDRAYKDVFLSGRYTYAAAAGVVDWVLDQHAPAALASTSFPLRFRIGSGRLNSPAGFGGLGQGPPSTSANESSGWSGGHAVSSPSARRQLLSRAGRVATASQPLS